MCLAWRHAMFCMRGVLHSLIKRSAFAGATRSSDGRARIKTKMKKNESGFWVRVVGSCLVVPFAGGDVVATNGGIEPQVGFDFRNLWAVWKGWETLITLCGLGGLENMEGMK